MRKYLDHLPYSIFIPGAGLAALGVLISNAPIAEGVWPWMVIIGILMMIIIFFVMAFRAEDRDELAEDITAHRYIHMIAFAHLQGLNTKSMVDKMRWHDFIHGLLRKTADYNMSARKRLEMAAGFYLSTACEWYAVGMLENARELVAPAFTIILSNGMSWRKLCKDVPTALLQREVARCAVELSKTDEGRELMTRVLRLEVQETPEPKPA